jgi:hypothetical protein
LKIGKHGSVVLSAYKIGKQKIMCNYSGKCVLCQKDNPQWTKIIFQIAQFKLQEYSVIKLKWDDRWQMEFPQDAWALNTTAAAASSSISKG